jgi:hypothetical protein
MSTLNRRLRKLETVMRDAVKVHIFTWRGAGEYCSAGGIDRTPAETERAFVKRATAELITQAGGKRTHIFCWGMRTSEIGSPL